MTLDLVELEQQESLGSQSSDQVFTLSKSRCSNQVLSLKHIPVLSLRVVQSKVGSFWLPPRKWTTDREVKDAIRGLQHYQGLVQPY